MVRNIFSPSLILLLNDHAHSLLVEVDVRKVFSNRSESRHLNINHSIEITRMGKLDFHDVWTFTSYILDHVICEGQSKQALIDHELLILLIVD